MYSDEGNIPCAEYGCHLIDYSLFDTAGIYDYAAFLENVSIFLYEFDYSGREQRNYGNISFGNVLCLIIYGVL